MCFHNWEKWEIERKIVYEVTRTIGNRDSFKNGELIVIIQERTCRRCGKIQYSTNKIRTMD